MLISDWSSDVCSSDLMPGSTPENRRATYFAMIDTLAALHGVDVEAAGLSDYGKPGNYFGRQVNRWTKQYKLSETETMDEMERLIAWLPATLPEQTRTSVVQDRKSTRLNSSH